ncbi:hypothetical protein KCU70_g224, partial [Aureobasidium melanogenum]
MNFVLKTLQSFAPLRMNTTTIVAHRDLALLAIDPDLDFVHVLVALLVVGGVDQNFVENLVQTGPTFASPGVRRSRFFEASISAPSAAKLSLSISCSGFGCRRCRCGSECRRPSSRRRLLSGLLLESCLGFGCSCRLLCRSLLL